MKYILKIFSLIKNVEHSVYSNLRENFSLGMLEVIDGDECAKVEFLLCLP